MPKTDTDTVTDGAEETLSPAIPVDAPPSATALSVDQAFEAFTAQYATLWEGKPAAEGIAFYSTRLKELFGSL